MTRDLIVFGEDWGAHPSSTQHLVREFLRERRVIWINSLGLRAPRLTLKDGRRILGKLADLARRSFAGSGPEPAGGQEPQAIIAPAAVPLPGSRIASSMTRHFVSRQVRSAMGALGIRKPVLWTSLPTAEPMIGAFGEHAVVYYAGDDFGALEGVDHDPVLRHEARLAKRAELILAASPEIGARFPASKTMVVPHGVDIELFTRPTRQPKDIPVGAPVIGFYGSLSGWIDIELIARVARALPQVHFCLIGPICGNVERIDNLSNVFMLGPKPHHELPAYLQRFDVAMLPFRDTPQIRACNPLKLREYLASGVPIVSTEFPALDPYRSLLHVGTDTRSFLEAIRSALADKSRTALRQRAVRNETWARRAEDIAAVIDLI